jgi:hypothetical protein
MSILSNKEPTNDPDFLAAALDYASRGCSIIAVKGKKPAGLWLPF